MAPLMQMSASQWLLLGFLSVLWGGSFFFVAIVLQELRPFTLVAWRVALAAAILVALVAALRLKWPSRQSDWAAFAVMAILNNVIPFTLIAHGQQQIPSGLASVLNATTPLSSVVLAHFLTADEKLTANRLAGVLLGVAGVAVLVGPEAIAGRSASVLGMLCILGATVSYALSGVWGRRFKDTPPVLAASCQLICSALFIVPVALFADRPWQLHAPSAAVIAAVLGLAVLSTSLAYVVFFRILAVSGATNVMLVTLLVPVNAILLGTLVLSEAFALRHAVGAVLIGIALLTIDGRVLGWPRPPQTRGGAT
jgi:drug/metabolite transporter (DMT)-like permease